MEYLPTTWCTARAAIPDTTQTSTRAVEQTSTFEPSIPGRSAQRLKRQRLTATNLPPARSTTESTGARARRSWRRETAAPEQVDALICTPTAPPRSRRLSVRTHRCASSTRTTRKSIRTRIRAARPRLTASCPSVLGMKLSQLATSCRRATRRRGPSTASAPRGCTEMAKGKWRRARTMGATATRGPCGSRSTCCPPRRGRRPPPTASWPAGRRSSPALHACSGTSQTAARSPACRPTI
mmetsp:Transcript_8012/g.12633  ORF Transcript_8012/g.12633 Transcript_8012/m.12633 type:complete len:239 (-) Transcript_8012:1097-1813(-)